MTTALNRRIDGDKNLTIADIFKRFGPIPCSRIRNDPPPGAATERDVVRIEASEGRLCELIDGILLEKAVGYDESLLAAAIIEALRRFVRKKHPGLVAGEAGMLALAPGLILIPDVSYVSLARLPNGRRPRAPIPNLVPDLAVEVLSPSNTRQELRRKLVSYFKCGVRLVWFVDPRKRIVEVFTAPSERVVIDESETLTGGGVLPGFKLELRSLFSELDRS
jgi:Uma2 family endonuclease